MTAAGDSFRFITSRAGATTALLTRAFDDDSMISASGEALTLTGIVLDGGKDGGRTSSADGGIVSLSSGKLYVRENAVLRSMASTGSGSAVYAAGEVWISGGQISGNTASAAVHVAGSGKLTMSGGQISSNSAGGVHVAGQGRLDMSGGQIRANSSSGITVEDGSAKLYFSGDAVVYGNLDSGNQKNIVLDVDSNDVIHTADAGLGAGAKLGVYVTGPEDGPQFTAHGMDGKPFGTHGASTENLSGFINDRNGHHARRGKTDEQLSAHQIIWDPGLETVPVYAVVMDDRGDFIYQEPLTRLTVNLGQTVRSDDELPAWPDPNQLVLNGEIKPFRGLAVGPDDRPGQRLLYPGGG